MRDTARLQVLALALIGAIAWVSVDLGDVRTALAGLVHETPASAPADPAGLTLDTPLLGEDIRPRHLNPQHPRPLRIGHPTRNIWIVTRTSEAHVG